MTVQAAWTIAGLYTFAYLLLLGYTCWLHKRILRIEHLIRLATPPIPKNTPCPGALCKAGRLPNGDLCRLCQPPHPLGPLCPDCSARGNLHAVWCDRL